MAESGEFRYNVHSISVVVENRGHRPAVGCEGAIILAMMDGLALRPQTRQYTVNTKEKHFDVQAKSKIALVAAWHLSPDGAIDSSKPTITPGEFLEKGLPLTVVISHGAKRIHGSYTKEEFRKTFEEHQVRTNVYEVR